jgi:hypothetical protein
MLAAVREQYAGPETVALRDVDRPAVGDEDVLVEVWAAALDPGVWHLATDLPYVVRLAGYGIVKPTGFDGYTKTGAAEADQPLREAARNDQTFPPSQLFPSGNASPYRSLFSSL